MSVRKYELMVILDPSRTEEQQTETLDHIDDVIKKYGGTPDKRDVWGKRRMAYQIARRRDGYYAVLLFDAESTTNILEELDRYCKYQDEILRHLVTMAVVGKSTGNPALAEQAMARQGGPGGYQRGGFRGGDRDNRPPRRGPEESAQAPAAAPSAPAESAPAKESASSEENNESKPEESSSES